MSMILHDDDLFDNPSPRVPVVLCLDTSGSMSEGGGATRPIDELNRGLKMFFDAVKNDEMSRYSAELSIITFGYNGVQKIREFQLIDRATSPPKLIPSGMTPMAEAVEMALDLVQSRKDQYKSAGVEYFQPWLVLMTDGKPDSPEKAEKIGRLCQQLIQEGKLVVFPIAIGENADLKQLQHFTLPTRKPLKLKGLCFEQFFEWLSSSLSRVSASTPGDKIQLDMEGLAGWAEL